MKQKISIARKNLFSDRIRFAITLLGVTFSVILMFCTFGMYLGFMENSSMIIENSNADIWVTSQNCKNFDFAYPIPEWKEKKVREVKGVALTEKLIVAFSTMKLKSGGSTDVEVLGYDPVSKLFAPWNIIEGNLEDVKRGRGVIVDNSSRKRMEGFVIGDKREIMGKTVKIAAVTTGLSSFIQSDIVFTSYRTAREVTPWLKNQTMYILVRVAPGFSREEVAKRISGIKGVDAYTKRQFIFKTKMFWTKETGMGIAFSFVIGIGFLVGMVIVGQTIYAATLENLREFGTLKAIGATNKDIYKIIFEQALWTAMCGYVFGTGLSFLIRVAYEKQGLLMSIPQPLTVGMFFATLFMCLFSSFVSIRKAVSVDPVTVFRA